MYNNLQINASEITPRFQATINEQIKRFWIGHGYPGNRQPLSSYKESFLTILGEIPVLITGPHAVPHDRGQETLKPQDNNTDYFVTEICKNLNCYGLIPLKPLADPNKLCSPARSFNPPTWHATSEVTFFFGAEKLIREKTMQLLIDIHGLVDGFEHSVVIGTAGSKGRKGWAKELKDYLNQNGIKTSIDSTQTPSGEKYSPKGGCFVRNISIPALQLEISRRYRASERIHVLSRVITDFLRVKFAKTTS